MGSKIHAGDIGTIFIVDTGENISTATSTDLKVRKPDGSTTVWGGSLYGTNFIKYTIQAGDLVAGDYRLQAYIEMPTWIGYGEEVEFHVERVIGG